MGRHGLSDEPAASAGTRTPVSRGSFWPGVALTGNQLAIMAANLVLSLQLAAVGGVGAVGAVAPCLLVFQLGSGLMQQVLAEASLLAPSQTSRRLELQVCQKALAAAVTGGLVGLGLAAVSAAMVPGGDPTLGLVFALGIPAAHGLDIGRAAAVAWHTPKPAAGEAAAWGLTQLGLMLLAGRYGSPVWICAAWTATNWLFFLGSQLSPARRPAFSGAFAWLKSQRGFAAPASVDALLSGLAPLIAIQLSALVTSAATIGTVRILQQLLAPLSFISVSVRKLLIFRRSADQRATRAMSVRDGLIAVGLVSGGAVALIAALLVAQSRVPALVFIPTGAAMLLAGAEKVAQGFSFGATLNKFLERDFVTLLRARVVFFLVCALALPALCAWRGAPGYLFGASAAVVIYAITVLASSSWRRDETRERAWTA